MDFLSRVCQVTHLYYRASRVREKRDMQGTENAEPCLVGAILRSWLAVVISEHLLMLNAEGMYYSKANHANDTTDNRMD